MIAVTISALSLSCCELYGQENNKSEKPGLAVYAGIGSLFSGAGAMLEYQLPLVKKIKLDPFISIGSQAVSTEVPGSWFGYSYGLNLEFGKIDSDKGTVLNWLAGINYGSQGVGFDTISFRDTDSSIRIRIHEHLLTGFSGIAGYKVTNRWGFTWQVFMGMAYVKNPIADNTNYFFKPTGGFGVGYKF